MMTYFLLLPTIVKAVPKPIAYSMHKAALAPRNENRELVDFLRSRCCEQHSKKQLKSSASLGKRETLLRHEKINVEVVDDVRSQKAFEHLSLSV